MPRKKLPIGIQTLREIREDDHYYVDKTGIAVDLVETGKYYFLSRPRRFGKSLFVDTLKELFEGNRALFAGLAAETRWDWDKKYPVIRIRISFGAGVVDSKAKLQDSIDGQLLAHELVWELQQQHLSINRRFINLIAHAHAHAHAHARSGQRVVVLVDEYDKPILDCITDTPLALQVRETLKDLYSVIKDSDAHIRFAFLTGVCRRRQWLLQLGQRHRLVGIKPPCRLRAGKTTRLIRQRLQPRAQFLAGIHVFKHQLLMPPA
ncbi:MAG: AAA family ATPase [Rhodoferax sp.]|nr:AAA family ATPase [Rhodoferax sp.]